MLTTKTGSDYDLDYTFVAETYNGNIIKQTPDDKPKFSSWGTMITDLTTEKIKRFSLVGKGHVFTVDLTDGHFEVDGNFIYSPKLPPPRAELQLIYYRQIQRGVIGVYNQKVGVENKIMGPKVKYFIGWQCNYLGKNQKFEMGVD